VVYEGGPQSKRSDGENNPIGSTAVDPRTTSAVEGYIGSLQDRRQRKRKIRMASYGVASLRHRTYRHVHGKKKDSCCCIAFTCEIGTRTAAPRRKARSTYICREVTIGLSWVARGECHSCLTQHFAPSSMISGRDDGSVLYYRCKACDENGFIIGTISLVPVTWQLIVRRDWFRGVCVCCVCMCTVSFSGRSAARLC